MQQQYQDYMSHYNAGPNEHHLPTPPPVPGLDDPSKEASPKRRKEKRDKNVDKTDEKQAKKRRKVEMTVEEEADEIIRRAEAEDMGLIPPEEEPEPAPPGVDSPEKPVRLKIAKSPRASDTKLVKKVRKSSSKTEVEKDGKSRKRRSKTEKEIDTGIAAPDSTVEVSSSTDRMDEQCQPESSSEKVDDKVEKSITSDVSTEGREKVVEPRGNDVEQKLLSTRRKVMKIRPGTVSRVKEVPHTDSADDSIKLKLVKRTKTRRVVKTETTETHETMLHEHQETEPVSSVAKTALNVVASTESTTKDEASQNTKPATTTTKTKARKVATARVRRVKDAAAKSSSADTLTATVTMEPVRKSKSEDVSLTNGNSDETKSNKMAEKVEKRKESASGEVLELFADDHDIDDLLGEKKRLKEKLMAEIPSVSKWERENSYSEDDMERPQPVRRRKQEPLPK